MGTMRRGYPPQQTSEATQEARLSYSLKVYTFMIREMVCDAIEAGFTVKAYCAAVGISTSQMTRLCSGVGCPHGITLAKGAAVLGKTVLDYINYPEDRKSVVEGKRGELGGRRII